MLHMLQWDLRVADACRCYWDAAVGHCVGPAQACKRLGPMWVFCVRVRQSSGEIGPARENRQAQALLRVLFIRLIIRTFQLIF
jgi:hypothetical protein